MKHSIQQLLSKSIQTLLVSLIVTQFTSTPLHAATVATADPAERLNDQINIPAAVKLADEAPALEARGDFEGALEKLKQAMRIAPPVAALYHERAYILSNLGRGEEALQCLNFAVDLSQTNPRALYNALVDRATLHLAMDEKVEALADALQAKKLPPAAANPGRVKSLNSVLAATNPLGFIWKRKGNIHTPQGDVAEILVLKADGKLVLHHQKIRPDGGFTQMDIPDRAWTGDVVTAFGTSSVANGRLKMVFTQPNNRVIDAVYYNGAAGEELTLRYGNESDTYTRVAWLVDSLDDMRKLQESLPK
jgi:tetratricopeptide (TPR) repeat protein